MNNYIFTEEEHFEHVYTPIELIGIAKNNIVQAMELIELLPPEYTSRLRQAYSLLSDVQEYLFEN